MPMTDLLNTSVNATLSRSIITHVTVTLALLALLLFGGPAIHSFTATMMFGVVLVGTYTSVFIASPMLIYLGVGTGRAEAADAKKALEAKAGKGSKPLERPAGGQKKPQGPQSPARPEPIRGR
jgi:preprotein translocase subunit SecF